jgi:hypothetical protein
MWIFTEEIDRINLNLSVYHFVQYIKLTDTPSETRN